MKTQEINNLSDRRTRPPRSGIPSGNAEPSRAAGQRPVGKSSPAAGWSAADIARIQTALDQPSPRRRRQLIFTHRTSHDRKPATPATAAAPPADSAAARPCARRGSGQVVSAKMNKTIVVEVIRRVPHPKFKKIVKRTTKFYAHDEKSEAREGQRVRIMEIPPAQQVEALARSSKCSRN